MPKRGSSIEEGNMEFESGDFGISVGTENGIEGLKKAQEASEFRGDLLLINVSTLIRNAQSVITTGFATIENVTALVLSDMGLIKQLVKRLPTPIPVEFYYCTYEKLRKQKQVVFKSSFTDKQQLLVDVQDGATLAILSNEDYKKDIVLLDTRLDKWRKDAALMSHIPADLLSFNEFQNLRLLESHTGTIKGRELFYTKLRRDAKVPLPFNIFTLNVFGDKAMFFEGQPVKVRNVFNKLVAKYKWTAITSLRYMIHNIESDASLHQRDKDVILNLSKVTY